MPRLRALCAVALLASGCGDDGPAEDSQPDTGTRTDASESFGSGRAQSSAERSLPRDAGACERVTCRDGGVLVNGLQCDDGTERCPWTDLSTSGENLCPGSYLGCDSAARALPLGDCRFETATRPDAIRVRGVPGNECVHQVDDCDHEFGWRQETTDAGTPDRQRFRLCGTLCESVTAVPAARIDAIYLCKEQ